VEHLDILGQLPALLIEKIYDIEEMLIVNILFENVEIKV